MTKKQLTAQRQRELSALINTGFLSRNRDDDGYTINIHTTDDTLGISNTNALRERHGNLLAFTDLYGGCEVVLYDHKLEKCRLNTLADLLDTLLDYRRYPVLDENGYSDLSSEREHEAWEDYLWDDILDDLKQLYDVYDTDDFMGWLDDLDEHGDFREWARMSVIIEEDNGGFFVDDKKPIIDRVYALFCSYLNDNGGELPEWAMDGNDEKEAAWNELWGELDKTIVKMYPHCDPRDVTEWINGRIDRGLRFWLDHNVVVRWRSYNVPISWDNKAFSKMLRDNVQQYKNEHGGNLPPCLAQAKFD